MAQWAAMFGGFRRDDDREGGGGVLGLVLMAVLAPWRDHYPDGDLTYS
jgi:heat shock protein HtpX